MPADLKVSLGGPQLEPQLPVLVEDRRGDIRHARDFLAAERAAPDVEVVGESGIGPAASAPALLKAHSATPWSASALPMILASSGLVFWKSAKTAWRSPWLSASTSQSAGSEIVTSPDWCSVQPSGVGAAGTAVGVGVAGTTVGVAGVAAWAQGSRSAAEQ